ncbi:RNA pyrophosphohydrolase [Sulfurovum sp. ST-21]|uniref:RNA pyrophosphohydrolase n=1 Tax=Sulfurovum indicum TaxID=2779528 RepID=A0A7M1S3D9_9BACT|nr:RNA pyrophosphohydrolase [Sulfurovum indicum]QOR61511.1 RNA pyrophosphohydrolase [Sulfurovum indicum]
MQNKKRYRPNVAAVILSSKYPEKCEFFVAHRSDIKNAWQFPQGGIDEGETPREALHRELLEEIGCNDVEILGEFPEWITYDFPSVARGKCYPYDGQTQKYFLVRLKEEAKIDLQAFEIPEFEEYEFVEYEELFRKVTYFKRKVYRRVIDYFIQEGLI